MANIYTVREIVGSKEVSTFSDGEKLAKTILTPLKENQHIELDFSGTMYHTSLFFNGLFDYLKNNHFDLKEFKVFTEIKSIPGVALAILNRSLNNGISIQEDPEYKRVLDEAFEKGMTTDHDQ